MFGGCQNVSGTEKSMMAYIKHQTDKHISREGPVTSTPFPGMLLLVGLHCPALGGLASPPSDTALRVLWEIPLGPS